ncbi:MAG: ribosomal protein S18-alanine N-acetyltransferase [Nitrospinota bacterium]
MSARREERERSMPEGAPQGSAGAPAAYRLRLMRKEDIPFVMPIEVLSYSLPWTEAAFERELDDIPFSRLLAVESAAEKKDAGRAAILGYGCWWMVKGECHITNVTVAPEARRKGVGRFLLWGILDDARRQGATEATLEVRVSNAAAIVLYENFGFTSVAMREGYYPDNGEDAMVMWMASL